MDNNIYFCTFNGDKRESCEGKHFAFPRIMFGNRPFYLGLTPSYFNIFKGGSRNEHYSVRSREHVNLETAE